MIAGWIAAGICGEELLEVDERHDVVERQLQDLCAEEGGRHVVIASIATSPAKASAQ